MTEISGELKDLNKIEPDENENILEIPDEDFSLSEIDDDDDIKIADFTRSDIRQNHEQIAEIRSSSGDEAKTDENAFSGKLNGIAETIGRNLARVGGFGLTAGTRKTSWLFPVAGIGIGAILAAVLFENQKPKRKISHRYNNFDVPQTRQRFDSDASEDLLFQTSETIGEKIERDAEAGQIRKTDSKLSGVSDAAAAVYKEVNRAAGKTYRAVGKASAYGYEKAGDLGSEIAGNYQHYKEESPLAVGAVALTVGAAIGYAIPLTKIENEYLGDVRDKVAERVQSSVQETIDSVKQTIEDGRQIIAEEIKSRTAVK